MTEHPEGQRHRGGPATEIDRLTAPLSQPRVITFGTFDVFHVGHLSILERARDLGGSLVVGVSTDQLNISKKGRSPVYPEHERLRIVTALRCVDAAFYEESLELKRSYVEWAKADVLVMGDDWSGRFDHLRDACEVVYLPRTPAVSTTATIEKIRSSPG
jgi:choline-phosphate cytidylyltransferase